MLLERSRALLAAGDAAATAFERALEHGAASGAVIEVARTRLAYGQWLRRHDRVEDSREHLAAALRSFERASSRLGVARAGAELAAAGVGAARRAPGTAGAGVEALSPLELQIARLAAAGASEEEIADRTCLPHRTVSSHLRRASAKLGTTSRAQLRRALGPHREP
nr:helix-turn-helix transcriptional regulator [Kineococcus vitellinus]